MSLTKLTVKETLDGLKDKKFSAKELVSNYEKNINDGEHHNAFITKTLDIAYKQAEESDKNIHNSSVRSLEGLPMAHKDLFCTKGVLTTAGSKILSDFVSPYESTVTQKLKNSGVIMLGKLNLDEFAMGSANNNKTFGATINTYKGENGENLSPGGSSGASALAVGANMAAATTATDTGGSIRQPAAFCGVTGIKPTYGRCSRFGMIAYASSLDQAGVISKDVESCAIVLENMVGHDEKDSTSAKINDADFSDNINDSVKDVKIGIPKEYKTNNVPDEILKTWDLGIKALKNRGAKIVEVSLPNTKHALASYYTIAMAEASSNLSRFDGVRYGVRKNAKSLDEMYEKTRAYGFSEEVKTRILSGTYVLSAGFYDAYYLKAQKIRRMIADDFKNVFQECEAILSPITPSAAFSFDSLKNESTTDTYLHDIFTVPLNLAGLPGLSLPVSKTKSGLPLSLQIMGRAYDEKNVFRIAKALESEINWKMK